MKNILCLISLLGLVIFVPSSEAYGQGTIGGCSANLRSIRSSLNNLTLGSCRLNGYPRYITPRLRPFVPSGVTTPLNGPYTKPTKVSELDAMNLSFVVKAQSLPPKLYEAFSEVANALPIKRATMLRRLIYELPSRMEGTTYIPPSPEQMFQQLRKVYYSTDAEVEAYWRAQK